MNLEELKSALASDATEKVKEQEAEIKRLKKELANTDSYLKEKDEMLRHMFNRCRALTQSAMCIFCGYCGACDALRSVFNKNSHNGERKENATD